MSIHQKEFQQPPVCVVYVPLLRVDRYFPPIYGFLSRLCYSSLLLGKSERTKHKWPWTFRYKMTCSLVYAKRNQRTHSQFSHMSVSFNMNNEKQVNIIYACENENTPTWTWNILSCFACIKHNGSINAPNTHTKTLQHRQLLAVAPGLMLFQQCLI